MINIDARPSVSTFTGQRSNGSSQASFRLPQSRHSPAIPGREKTTFAMAIADHVATGADFLGRRCIQRKVLVLDRDNSRTSVCERLNRLRIQD